MPMRVIGMLLGIPEADQPRIRDRVDENLRTEAGRPMRVSEGFADGEQFAEYIDWRAEHPSDDIMSDLLNAEFEDETGTVRRLRRDELLTYITVVSGAGNETTTRLIGWAGKVLAEHPDQRRELVDDPSLIPGAIEELLRFEPPAPHVGRYVARDAEFQGQTLPAGSALLCPIGSANRDDRQHPDGDRFDIHRTSGPHPSMGRAPRWLRPPRCEAGRACRCGRRDPGGRQLTATTSPSAARIFLISPTSRSSSSSASPTLPNRPAFSLSTGGGRRRHHDALSGATAVFEGEEQAAQRMQARVRVAHAVRRDRVPVRVAGHPRQPRGVLDDEGEGGIVPPGAVEPEAGHAHHDDVRPDGAHGVGIEPQLVQHPRRVVLDHDVAGRDQPPKELPSLVPAETEGDAPLVGVQAGEDPRPLPPVGLRGP
jgi:hypothetical protein